MYVLAVYIGGERVELFKDESVILLMIYLKSLQTTHKVLLYQLRLPTIRYLNIGTMRI